MTFNLQRIRTLLTEGFSIDELRRFCFEHRDFRAVHHQLSPEMGKDKVIDRLLEHSEQTLRFKVLLAWAKEQNPARYEQHQPYYNEFDTFIPHQTFYSNDIQGFLDRYLGSDQQSIPFGGRDEELAKLNSWLANPKAPPYLLLTAPAGRGKSALLCRWFDKLRKDTRTHVIFVPVSIRDKTNVSQVVFSELGAQLARLHREPIQSADWSPDRVSSYLRRPIPDNEQWLIILDGLDEAAGWEVKASLFPATPPSGLRVVVSARPLPGDKDEQNWLYRLGWERSGLAYHLNLTSLTQADIADVLKKMGPPLDTLARNMDCLIELYRLSEEGDPLLVSLYVEDLQGRVETAPYRSPEDLLAIPSGLEGYFSRWWEEQRNLWGSAAPLKEPIVQTLFNLLACALGPLSQADILTLARDLGLTDWITLEEALRSLRRLVIGDGTQQGYAFTHPRLGIYFYEKLDTYEQQKWRERYLVWGKKTLGALKRGDLEPGEVSPYLLQYYGAHLFNERSTDLFELVDETWMRAQEARGGYDGFLADVRRAWDLAKEIGQEEAKAGKPITTLGIQLKCVLCFSSVASLASKLPPHLPALLVRDKIWNPEQARAYAYRVPDTLQRIRTKLALLQVEEVRNVFEAQDIWAITASILSDIDLVLSVEAPARYSWLRLGQSDDEELMARLLVELLPYLKEVYLIEEAYQIALKFKEKTWRVFLFGNLTPLIPHEQQVKVLSYALQETSQMGYSEFNDKVNYLWPYLLEAIALNLPEGVLDSALEVGFKVDHLEKDWHKNNEEANRRTQIIGNKIILLQYLARHIPLKQVDEFLGVCHRHCPDVWSIASIIIILAPRLSQQAIKTAFDYLQSQTETHSSWDRSSNLRYHPIVAMIFLAHYVQDPELKASRLHTTKSLLSRLPISYSYDKVKPSIETLYEIVAGICSDEEAAKRVAKHRLFPEWDDYDLFPCMGSQTVKQLFVQTKNTIPYNDFMEVSPYMLPTIAKYLSDEARQSLVSEFEKSERYGDWARYRAISSVAYRLSPQAIEKATKIASRMLSAYFDSRLELLSLLAPYLSVETINELTQGFYYSDRLEDWMLLQKLAPKLPSTTRQVAALDVQNSLRTTYNIKKAEGLAVLAKSMEDTEQRKHIIDFLHQNTEFIGDLPERAGIINALAEILTQYSSHSQAKRLRKLVTEQAQHDFKTVFTTFDTRLIYLDYLPFWKRVPEGLKLLQIGTSSHQKGEVEAFSTFLMILSRSRTLRMTIHAGLLMVLILNSCLARLVSKNEKTLYGDLPARELISPTFLTTDIYKFDGWRYRIDLFSKEEPYFARILWNISTFTSEIFNDVPPNGVARFLSRVLERLTAIKPKSDETVREMPFQISKQEIARIVELEQRGQRHAALQDLFKRIHSNLGWYGNGKILREKGAETWRFLPDNLFDDVLSCIHEFYKGYSSPTEEWATNLIILMPALAKRRPDLLPKIQKAIEFFKDSRSPMVAYSYSNLAYFLKDKQQQTTISLALESAANSRFGDPKWTCCLVLEDVTEYVTAQQLPFVAQCFEKYLKEIEDDAELEALNIMAKRMGESKELFEIIWPILWPIVKRLNAPYILFVCTASPYFNPEQLAEVIIYSAQKFDYWVISVFACLRDRWLELPRYEAYKVWGEVIQVLSTRPRSELLKHLSWFSNVILNLGKEQAIIDTGESILEIGHWWR